MSCIYIARLARRKKVSEGVFRASVFSVFFRSKMSLNCGPSQNAGAQVVHRVHAQGVVAFASWRLLNFCRLITSLLLIAGLMIGSIGQLFDDSRNSLVELPTRWLGMCCDMQ